MDPQGASITLRDERLPETGATLRKNDAKSNAGHQAEIFILSYLEGKTKLSKRERAFMRTTDGMLI